jgi:hypothetical protein
MRAVTVLALAVAALAATAVGSANAPQPTALSVIYRADGAGSAPASEPTRWTLRCNPPRGTLRRPGIACRRLAAGGPKLFASVPQGAICTEIYGGPHVALVVGVVSGTRIWTRFTRENGCQIARWNRLSPWLLPRGGVS